MITDLEREKTMGAKLEVALLILRRISRRAQRAMAYCLRVETVLGNVVSRMLPMSTQGGCRVQPEENGSGTVQWW